MDIFWKHTLEVSSIQNLLQYFQGAQASGEVYELKGLHVIKYDRNEFRSSGSEVANYNFRTSICHLEAREKANMASSFYCFHECNFGTSTVS